MTSHTNRSVRRQVLTEAPGCMQAGPYSLGAQVGGVFFTSGQIGLDADTRALVSGGIEAEAQQVFRNFEGLLAAAGLDFGDVVKCNAYLTDVGDFAAFNAIYAEQFAEPYPARTTVGVAALPLGAKVEVEMIVQPR